MYLIYIAGLPPSLFFIQNRSSHIEPIQLTTTAIIFVIRRLDLFEKRTKKATKPQKKKKAITQSHKQAIFFW
jgi:hypothetical protein